MTKWLLRQCNNDEVTAMAETHHIHPMLAKILYLRGIKAPQEVKAFLRPEENPALYDPFTLLGMDACCDLLLSAIEEETPITVFGDYDVDGITATTILYKLLQKLDAQVDYYIPQREAEGYGLNMAAIDYLAEKGTGLLLTCDTGIAAVKEVAYAKEKGMTVIVTDHHEIPFALDENGVESPILPPADAVVNAKNQDCPYPCKALCGAGVTYKIAEALYQETGLDWQADEQEYLELATIATVCDLVDLVGENHFLVKRGLKVLATPRNLGINALIQAAGIEGKEPTCFHIGFILGPCINASGRLDMATLAVELFISEDEIRCREIAAELVALNQERKQLTAAGVKAAEELLATGVYQNDKVLVLYLEDLPESVAGIVAGRIKEKYYQPVFILTNAYEEGFVKGSGRSIEGYHMFQAISSAKELLTVFGGHPMAAGLTMPKENIEAFRNQLNAEITLSEEDMKPVYLIDHVLPMDSCNLRLLELLDRLEPFGKSNPQPIFADKGLQVLKVSCIGKEQNVLKIKVKTGRNMIVEPILFGQKDKFIDMLASSYATTTWESLQKENLKGHDVYLDFLYTVNLNEYQGKRNCQIQIKDFRPAKQ